MNNVNNILSQVKISKNNEVNDFMKSFVYHNEKFFEKCLNLKLKNLSSLPESGIGIYYEKGPWKWGSQGMENQMIKRGHIKVLRSDDSTSCLNATVKLVNRILNNCYRTIENIKCVREGRYDDRKLNPCR